MSFHTTTAFWNVLVGLVGVGASIFFAIRTIVDFGDGVARLKSSAGVYLWTFNKTVQPIRFWILVAFRIGITLFFLAGSSILVLRQ